MRFLARAFWGLVIVALSAAALAYGVADWRAAREEAVKAPPKRTAPERIYTVRDVTLAQVTVAPVTVAYGRIEAGRVLELRAAQPGRIVDIAPNFRDGAEVAAGTVLLRIDPANTRSREADLLAALADARSRETESRQAARLAQAELETALRQLELRRAALRRQQQLLDRGVASQAALETAQIAVNSDQQAINSRRQSLTAAMTRVDQAELAVERAQIALSDARRDVADLDVSAPFGGVLDATGATLGRLVNANETLGTLIDLDALEVAFRLTDTQFARVLDEAGRVRALPAQVVLTLGEREIVARAVLERAAARAQSEGGRTVYAGIAASPGTPLRPGDFVQIRLAEPPLTEVAEIPVRAATENGTVYVIGEDDRLEARQVEIVRRMADSLIIADAPFGARIVAELRPQLGPGIRVQTPEQAAARAEEERKRKAARRGGGATDDGGRPAAQRPEKPGDTSEKPAAGETASPPKPAGDA